MNSVHVSYHPINEDELDREVGDALHGERDCWRVLIALGMLTGNDRVHSVGEANVAAEHDEVVSKREDPAEALFTILFASLLYLESVSFV